MYLDMEVGLGVEEVEDALVVEELGIPLLWLVVAEIVAQGHQQHLAAVQLGLLAVLVQQQLGSAMGGQGMRLAPRQARGAQSRLPLPLQHSPLCHVGIGDGSGRHLPRAVDPATRQALEVKLAADLGVWPAGVRHVIAVEGHHVAEDVGAGIWVCGIKDR